MSRLSGNSAPSGREESQHPHFPVLFKPHLFAFVFVLYAMGFFFSHPPLESPLPAHGNNSSCSLGVPSPPKPVSKALMAEEGLEGAHFRSSFFSSHSRLPFRSDVPLGSSSMT